MIRLQIRLSGPDFSSFSTNSYGYYSQTSQKLVSNFRIFASARIVRQPPSNALILLLKHYISKKRDVLLDHQLCCGYNEAGNY